MEVTRSEKQAALGDLRILIEMARARGELSVVDGADAHLEMGALYELSLKAKTPPLLLFENIRGFARDRRVLMNMRFSTIFNGELNLDALKSFREARIGRKPGIAPRLVRSGPVAANVLQGDAIDITRFPAGQWHEHDGGRYIGTEVVVITKDPDSDWVNLGTYRTQIQDERTVSVFIEPGKHGSLIREKWWAMGKACPMLVCVGQAPILGMVAGTSLQHGASEYETAGARIGRPIDIMRGELTGLPMPAEAEIVLEGFMPPPNEETRLEGPFAEWPGYYTTDAHPEPILRIGAVYHRDEPILTAQPPAKPTFPGRLPSLAGMAALWDALESAGVPGIEGVWKPLGGGTRFLNVISIRQLHQGHAKMAGLVATGAGPGAYLGRITIVVDDDIDITDPAEILWALATRWDPKTQTDIIDGCWSGYIDPVISPDKRDANDITSSRIIIYAVRPWAWKDKFPRVNVVDQAYSKQVAAKWRGKLDFIV